MPGVAENMGPIMSDSFTDYLVRPLHIIPNPLKLMGWESLRLRHLAIITDIQRWRRKQALGMTSLKGPDLLKNVNLSKKMMNYFRIVAEIQVKESE